jgi:hypothetical protein
VNVVLVNELIDITVSALAAWYIGYMLGRRYEQRRVLRIFDAARSVVTSGALSQVRRCMQGGCTVDELRADLICQAERRRRERGE